jgi:hypothetical protein
MGDKAKILFLPVPPLRGSVALEHSCDSGFVKIKANVNLITRAAGATMFKRLRRFSGVRECGHDKAYNAGEMRRRVFNVLSAVSLALGVLAPCIVHPFPITDVYPHFHMELIVLFVGRREVSARLLYGIPMALTAVFLVLPVVWLGVAIRRKMYNLAARGFILFSVAQPDDSRGELQPRRNLGLTIR